MRALGEEFQVKSQQGVQDRGREPATEGHQYKSARPATTNRLLLDPETLVICPKCAEEFNLQHGFAKRALEDFEAASRGALAAVREAERAEVERRAASIAAERENATQQEIEALRKLLKDQAGGHEKALREMQALTEKSLEPQLQSLRKALADRDEQLKTVSEREERLAAAEQALQARATAAAHEKAQELMAAERRGFAEQLAEKNSQVAALREEQLSLRKEREKLQDEKAALALEVQKQVDAQVEQREAVVRAQEAERSKLREAELQKKLDDVSNQLADAQRRAEQGSQQLQGEVLELALEDSLVQAFRLDTIEEVKKGARGGDVIQRVTTRTGQNAGVMLWETKRAKDWSPQWVAKLKEDMRAASADVGILVTMPTAVPKEWDAQQPFGLYEDVWVTTWSNAVCLAEVIRVGLIDVHKQRLISAGKGEKMEAVYDYLTSPQFAQKLKAVYNAFKVMKEENDRERQQAEQRWTRRDKQVQMAMRELIGIGGEIQGLAQQELPQLELEPGEQN
jgi:hypothetical protein